MLALLLFSVPFENIVSHSLSIGATQGTAHVFLRSWITWSWILVVYRKTQACYLLKTSRQLGTLGQIVCDHCVSFLWLPSPWEVCWESVLLLFHLAKGNPSISKAHKPVALLLGHVQCFWLGWLPRWWVGLLRSIHKNVFEFWSPEFMKDFRRNCSFLLRPIPYSIISSW